MEINQATGKNIMHLTQEDGTGEVTEIVVTSYGSEMHENGLWAGPYDPLNIPEPEVPIAIDGDPRGYVYVLQVGKYIKIGRTKNIRKRMKTLCGITKNYSTQKPGKVYISVPHVNYAETENTLHHAFSKERYEDGEIFKLSYATFLDRCPDITCILANTECFKFLEDQAKLVKLQLTAYADLDAAVQTIETWGQDPLFEYSKLIIADKLEPLVRIWAKLRSMYTKLQKMGYSSTQIIPIQNRWVDMFGTCRAIADRARRDRKIYGVGIPIPYEDYVAALAYECNDEIEREIAKATSKIEAALAS